jgi:predicted DNA-binding transcriptional regulator AlpA
MSSELVVMLSDAQLEVLAEKVAAKLRNGNGNGHAPEPDRLLTAVDAAKALGMTPRWMYAHASTLPFVVHLPGRTVRFSEAGLKRYIARKSEGGGR